MLRNSRPDIDCFCIIFHRKHFSLLMCQIHQVHAADSEAAKLPDVAATATPAEGGGVQTHVLDVTDPAAKKKAQRILDGINKEAHEKITAIAGKLEKGESFIKLAKEFSEDESSKEEGGSLGVLLPETTITAIAAEMTKLAMGETSGIIQSSYGYHIIRLNKIIASRMAPFEEVQPDILNLLMVRETQKLKEELLIRLKKNADIKIFI